jgi:hypothetical protein
VARAWQSRSNNRREGAAGAATARPEDVANAAARAKRRAKSNGVGLYLLDASGWANTSPQSTIADTQPK